MFHYEILRLFLAWEICVFFNFCIRPIDITHTDKKYIPNCKFYLWLMYLFTTNNFLKMFSCSLFFFTYQRHYFFKFVIKSIKNLKNVCHFTCGAMPSTSLLCLDDGTGNVQSYTCLEHSSQETLNYRKSLKDAGPGVDWINMPKSELGF